MPPGCRAILEGYLRLIDSDLMTNYLSDQDELRNTMLQAWAPESISAGPEGNEKPSGYFNDRADPNASNVYQRALPRYVT